MADDEESPTSRKRTATMSGMQRPARRSNPTPAPPVDDSSQGAEDESGSGPVQFRSGSDHLQGVSRPVAQRGSSTGVATNQSGPAPSVGNVAGTPPKRLTAFSPVGKGGGLMPPSSSDAPAAPAAPRVVKAPTKPINLDDTSGPSAEPVAADDTSARGSSDSDSRPESEGSGESREAGSSDQSPEEEDDGPPSVKRPREEEPEDEDEEEEEEADENAD